jgi:hypothetical protein
MIILHRPSRKVFQDTSLASDEDVRICDESLDNIVALLHTLSMKYETKHLPFNFVYILATAASIILIRRHLKDMCWHDNEIKKPLKVVEDALHKISKTWSCANQVIAVIQAAKARPTGKESQNDAEYDLTMTGVQEDYNMFNNGVSWMANIGISRQSNAMHDDPIRAIRDENNDCNLQFLPTEYHNGVPELSLSDLEQLYGVSTVIDGVDPEHFKTANHFVCPEKGFNSVAYQ